MKKYDLLILGNGFDLACKYKTSYSSFYDFLDIIYKSSEDNVLDNFYACFKELENDVTRNDKIIEFLSLKWKHYKNNIFVQYFLNYKRIFDDWVSFEKELLAIIKSFDILFDNLKKYECSPKIYDYICEFNESSIEYRVFSFIKKCKYYSIDISKHNNHFIFTINELHNLTPMEWIVKIEKYIADFVEYIYHELNRFSFLFLFYLEIITNNISTNISFDFFSNKIITYNYTNIGNIVFSQIESLEICNINGKMIYPVTQGNVNIVFGFNTDVKFKIKLLDILTKSSQRAAKNTDFTKLHCYLPEKKNNQEKSICVYGHSLDESDKDSLAIIFESFNEPNIDIYYLNYSSLLSIISNLKIILGTSKFNKYTASGKINYIQVNKS